MAISKDARLSDQDSAVAAIYDTLIHDLGQGQAATRDIFQRGGQALGQSYDAASSQLRSGTEGVAARLSGQINELGLGEALPQVVGGINDNNAFWQGQLAENRGVDTGSFSRQGTQYEAIGQVGINNAHKEKAQKRTSALETLRNALAQLEGEEIKARAAVETSRLEGAVKLAQMRAESRARAADRAAANAPKPLGPMDMLNAQYKGLQIDKLMRELENPKYGKGQLGLDQYLNSPGTHWNKKAGPKFRASLNSIIENAAASAADPANNVLGKLGPGAYADTLVPQAPSFINRDALRAALGLYYGTSNI